MSDAPNQPTEPDDDMSEYLQTFLDETEEQLDDLVETMLSLEKESTNKDDLNEAFRLIHSIKGSAGMMGLPYHRADASFGEPLRAISLWRGET